MDCFQVPCPCRINHWHARHASCWPPVMSAPGWLWQCHCVSHTDAKGRCRMARESRTETPTNSPSWRAKLVWILAVRESGARTATQSSHPHPLRRTLVLVPAGEPPPKFLVSDFHSSGVPGLGSRCRSPFIPLSFQGLIPERAFPKCFSEKCSGNQFAVVHTCNIPAISRM